MLTDKPSMIPLGYMLKSVTTPAPGWMNAPNVTAVHSLSNCVSEDFADYIRLWQHNGWWLFDTPSTVRDAARACGLDPDAFGLFYYEAFDRQYDDEAGTWRPFAPEGAFQPKVSPPSNATLSGFDVVTFLAGTSPECSPLSCNALADSLPVNAYCLFDSFEGARAALEGGAFKNSEPGPFRIVAVYSIKAG